MDAKYSRHDARRDATVSRGSDGERLDFPRACRLVHRVEYDAVYREGRKRTSREFTIFLRPNGLSVSRFGWSIKKALGSAVRRNRIRRRLRETLRLHRQEIAPGWDIVIHPRSSAATAEFLALGAELLALLPRADKAAK
ncbi:MAG TPA: ribonuclease P protein component [Candidatus Baltobacteraceae bacterium]|nr:ribonuclease P protein component [Candidatus Baltobacteraceae bacterium]